MGNTAFTDVSLGLAAATDHFHAIARLLKLEEPYGAAIAALTRGYLESMARAWWLLEVADEPKRFAHRAAALRVAEAKVSAAKEMPVEQVHSDGTRRQLEPGAVLMDAKALFAAVDTGEEATVPGYGKLSIGLMAAALVPNPVSLYSQLSGVAHGETLSIGGLSSVHSAGLGVGALGLPIRNYRVYMSMTTHVLDVCLTRVVTLWGARQELERWEQTRDRVWDTLAVLDEELDATDHSTEAVWDRHVRRRGLARGGEGPMGQGSAFAQQPRPS